MVDRLELAHADVLLALEKADGRFGGGRAARRVEAARSAEQVLLDELGLTSYSDYMIGYSLLNVDPEKEAELEAAREELAAAEDEWRTLECGGGGGASARRADGAAPAAARRGPALLGHPVKADGRSASCRACACRRPSRRSW